MKKHLLKAIVLCLSFAMMLSMLTACGGSNGGGGEIDTTALTIGSDSDYSTLHPANYSTTIEQRTNDQIYDTLLARDTDNHEELVPRVAEKWEVSEDGKCYTFFLRNDVKFQNGTPLTAKDIAFTLDMYSQSEYQGAVVDGFDHYEIVDDYTIKVYTSDVYAPFLPSMAQMFIGSKDYFDEAGEDKFAQEPVGCGAYKWVSHEDGNKWTLEAFDEYYGGAPQIKNVTFKVISDVTTLGVGLQTGEVNFAEISDPSYVDQLDKDENVTVEKIERQMFGFVAMNTEKEPFNNPTFRKAINYAMNRDDIVTSVKEGLATPNSNLLTPDKMGYSDSQAQYGYEPDKARELLKEAGIEEGFNLGTMYVAEQYKSLAQVVQANLAEVGLTCDIEILEFNAYLKKLGQGDFTITCLQMVLEGDTQQMSMAVCSDYIGMANNARYSDPEVDQWFKDAAATIDEGDRAAIYEKIFTKIQDEAVYAVLYNPYLLYAHNVNLNVPSGYPLEGKFFIKDFSWNA